VLPCQDDSERRRTIAPHEPKKVSYQALTRAAITRAKAKLAAGEAGPPQTFTATYRRRAISWCGLAESDKARREVDRYWAGRIAEAPNEEARASILAEEWGESRVTAIKKVVMCRLQEAIGHAADTAMRGVPARRIDPEIRPHNIRLAVPLAFAAHSGIKLHTRLVDIERGPLIPSIPPIPSIPSIPPIPPIPPIPSVRLFPVQFRESGQRTGSLPYKQRLYHSTRPHRKPTHAQGARSEVTAGHGREVRPRGACARPGRRGRPCLR
jgi:hypothetical protein